MLATRTAVVALLAFAAAVPATAQWRRIVLSGKGQSVDVPTPHALSYFTANPFLRDDGYEFCELCTPSGKAASSKKYTIRSMVKPVGVLAGYRVVDVLYYPSPRPNASETGATWKSILVQTSTDRYTEIFHLQAFYTTASVEPSRIVQSGDEPVLVTMDLDGGNGGGCGEGYWWFDSTGPHPLDFSRLETAIRERLSAVHQENARVQVSCSNLNLKLQQVNSGVQESHAQCHACDWVGRLTARFRLDGALVQPVAVDFYPENPQH
jgi:hypothetical protein